MSMFGNDTLKVFEVQQGDLSEVCGSCVVLVGTSSGELPLTNYEPCLIGSKDSFLL